MRPIFNAIMMILKKYLVKFKVIFVLFIILLPFFSIAKDSSIDKIFIINPDPWEKKRHFKRRLINKEFIALMYKKIKNGGKVIVTTDSSSYFLSIIEIIKSEEIDFEETVQKLLDKGDELYDISKYQKKGIEKGRKIHLVELKKI